MDGHGRAGSACADGVAEPQPGTAAQRLEIRVAVELAELSLHGWVSNNDPSPASEVAARGCLFGEINAIKKQLVVDGAFEIESTTHRPRGGENSVNLAGVRVHQFQRPVNFAGRLSRNDAMPSLKSSVDCTAADIAGIAAIAACSLMSNASRALASV